MINNTATKKKNWSVPIILIIIGLMLTVLIGKDLLVLKKDPIDVMKADPSDLKAGDHVIVNLSLVEGQAISVIETTKTYGVTTSQREGYRYYVIPYLYDYEKNKAETAPIAFAKNFILVKMSSNFFKQMDKAVEDTTNWEIDWWNSDYGKEPDPPGKFLTFEGQLKRLGSEESGYARAFVSSYFEFFESGGYSKNDLETILGYYDADMTPENELVVPYYIDPIMKPGAAVGGTIVGIAFLVAGIIVLVFMYRSYKEDQELETMMAMQKPRVINTEDDQEPEPAPAPKVSFNNSLSAESSPAAEKPSIPDSTPSIGSFHSEPATLPMGGGAQVASYSSAPAQLPMGGGSQVASFSSAPAQLPMGGGSSEIKHLSDGNSMGNPLPMSGSAPTESTPAPGNTPFMGALPKSGPTPMSGPSTGITPPPMGSSMLTGRIALPTDQDSSGSDKKDSN